MQEADSDHPAYFVVRLLFGGRAAVTARTLAHHSKRSFLLFRNFVLGGTPPTAVIFTNALACLPFQQAENPTPALATSFIHALNDKLKPKLVCWMLKKVRTQATSLDKDEAKLFQRFGPPL